MNREEAINAANAALDAVYYADPYSKGRQIALDAADAAHDAEMARIEMEYPQ